MGEKVNPPCWDFSIVSLAGYLTNGAVIVYSTENEESLKAREHETQVKDVLELFGKRVDNIVAICRDKYEVNKLLIRFLKKPLIGCILIYLHLPWKNSYCPMSQPLQR